jgi:FtsP/CotA-like multicopper oxidase with cupredoxin domain
MSERQDTLTVTSAIVAVLALVAAVFAVGLSSRDDGGSKVSTSVGGDAAGAPVAVTLAEFSIAPKAVRVGAGGSLQLTNSGTMQHNLAVKEDATVASPMIDPKGTGSLDLSKLKPGSYTLFCAVPGHEAAGMTAPLTITESSSGGGPAAAPMDHSSGSGGSSMAMDPDAMDKAMAARTHAFPDKTEGHGGELLQPTVEADGTKVFALTAKVVQWEVEAGKKVEAWTYNGTVPGPTIKVDVGDHVKVVLKNELPESTALHIHGVRLPNAMDGVPDITQDPIKPGDSFTYDFVAQRVEVGMYHSHHNAATQVSNGLAGTFQVGELPMPGGVKPDVETSLMLNDSGTIGFALNGKSFPATEPIVAKPGQRVLIHYLNEGVGAHPMHLHGLDQLVVAKDGFPLATPQKQDTVVVAPGERISVLVTADNPGVWAFHCHILTHAEREDGMFGMVTAMIVK